MSAATRLAYRLEGVVGAALARRFERAARRRARTLTIDRASLRGRRCHCPPGLAAHLVHSEALREACDVVVDWGSNVEHPGRRQLPVDAIAHVGAELRPGDAVHVKTELLDPFVALALPRIRVPFVLVTGDSDVSAVRAHAHLLDDERVAHWFAQNADVAGRHPKLTRVPIGVDNPVYTLLEKRLGFALTMLLGRTPWDWTVSRNDVGDQAVLARVRARARRAVGDKPARVLCTFHQNSKLAPSLGGVPARQAALAALVGHPSCHVVARRVPQAAYWAMHEDFAFEAAPRGKGLDTLRTWECLALGTIPIVRASTLDPLYEDEALPVVVVDAWDEITAERLHAWRAALAPRFTDDLARRLGADYWIAKIRAAQVAARTPGCDRALGGVGGHVGTPHEIE